MENAPITLILTVAQCNTVLTALAARPFVEVAEVITSIKNQGEKAVAELQAAAAPAAADEVAQ